MERARRKPDGDRSEDRAPKPSGQGDTDGRDTSETRQGETEEERARLDREAGDVGDDLADFA